MIWWRAGTHHPRQIQESKAQSRMPLHSKSGLKKGHEDWLSSQRSSMCLSAAETLSWHQLKRLHLSLQGKLKSSMLVILSDKVTRCQAGRAWPPRLSSGLLRVFSPLKTSVPTGQCLNYIWDTEHFACVNVACGGIHLFSVTWNQHQNKFQICVDGICLYHQHISETN